MDDDDKRGETRTGPIGKKDIFYEETGSSK